MGFQNFLIECVREDRASQCLNMLQRILPLRACQTHSAEVVLTEPFFDKRGAGAYSGCAPTTCIAGPLFRKSTN